MIFAFYKPNNEQIYLKVGQKVGKAKEGIIQ